MRIDVTLDELKSGVPVPLDERHTLRLVPSAIVEVRTPEGEPVAEELVLVKRADGSVMRHKTNANGNLALYGKKGEVFNVTLVGRPKGQQGAAKNAGGQTPHATVHVNTPDGAAVANEEVLIERADGARETYYTNAEGKVRLFGDPDEKIKLCLVRQLKGTVSGAAPSGASPAPKSPDPASTAADQPPAKSDPPAPVSPKPTSPAEPHPATAAPAPQTGSLYLSLLDSESGQPLAGLDVVLKDQAASELLLVTDDEGVARAEDLEAGSYSVEPVLGEHNPISVAVSLPAGQSTFQELKLEMIPYLEFDGSTLYWVNGDGSTDSHWPAVSGRPGHHSRSEQHLRDVGPLPEGSWDVRQSELQSIDDLGNWDRVKSEIGRGPWPGAENTWGRFRVWLHPRVGTNTYSRDDFSIHGGAQAGSAGCIDMTKHIDAFAEKYRASGRDMVLYVEYP